MSRERHCYRDRSCEYSLPSCFVLQETWEMRRLLLSLGVGLLVGCIEGVSRAMHGFVATLVPPTDSN